MKQNRRRFRWHSLESLFSNDFLNIWRLFEFVYFLPVDCIWLSIFQRYTQYNSIACIQTICEFVWCFWQAENWIAIEHCQRNRKSLVIMRPEESSLSKSFEVEIQLHSSCLIKFDYKWVFRINWIVENHSNCKIMLYSSNQALKKRRKKNDWKRILLEDGLQLRTHPTNFAIAHNILTEEKLYASKLVGLQFNCSIYIACNMNFILFNGIFAYDSVVYSIYVPFTFKLKVSKRIESSKWIPTNSISFSIDRNWMIDSQL